MNSVTSELESSIWAVCGADTGVELIDVSHKEAVEHVKKQPSRYDLFVITSEAARRLKTGEEENSYV